MFSLSKLMLVAAVVLVSTCVTANAKAATPEEIARKCINEIKELTKSGQASIDRTADQGVQQILRAKRSGNQVLARRLAERAANRIDQIARRSSEAIKQVCERCVTTLRKMQAYQLADKVREACRRALNAIEESQTAGKQKLRRALNS